EGPVREVLPHLLPGALVAEEPRGAGARRLLDRQQVHLGGRAVAGLDVLAQVREERRLQRGPQTQQLGVPLEARIHACEAPVVQLVERLERQLEISSQRVHVAGHRRQRPGGPRGQRGDDRLRQRAAGGGQAGGDGSGGGGHGPCLPRVPLIIHRGVPAALAALVVAVFAFDPLPFLLLPAIVLPALVVVEQLATFVPAEAVGGLADTVLVVEVR